MSELGEHSNERALACIGVVLKLASDTGYRLSNKSNKSNKNYILSSDPHQVTFFAFFLAFYLAHVSGTSSDILSGICIWHIFGHSF